VTTTLEPPSSPEAAAPPPPSGPWSGEALDRARRLWQSQARTAQAGRVAVAGVLFLLVVRIFFVYSLPELMQGISLGSLYGMIAVGLILIYRTNRILNFAAAAIGAVPAIAALMLDVGHGVPYLAVLPIAVVGGLVVGALADIIVVRRFGKSPRLILTVVTIGIAQSLGALGFFIPVWLGAKAGQIPNVPTPWEQMKILDAHGKPILTGNQVAALVTVALLATLVAAFRR